MSRGILSVGAYAPSNRIDAEVFEEAWGHFEADGVERKAVPDADEDALTMGVQAAQLALAAGDVENAGDGKTGDGETARADEVIEGTGDAGLDTAAPGAGIEQLWFASTTPPLAEEELAPRLGSYLGVPTDATTTAVGTSTSAGIDALLRALESDGTALVVVADCPTSEPDDAREHAAGAGAAAFLVGPDASATVVDRASVTDPRPGTRFRRHGSEDLEGLDAGTYDRDAFVEPIEAAVDDLESVSVESTPDAVAVQAPDGKLPYRTRLDSEAIAAVETVSELGDTAAASVPLSIARAFEAGADRTLAVAWGSGAAATALVIDGDAPVEASLDGSDDLDYPAYLRRRGDVVGEKPDGGAAHVPVPTWRRSIPQRHRHVAGRCPECGAVAFPPEGACQECLSLVEFDPVEPALEGAVHAATTIGQGGAPPEFAEQQARQGAFGVAIVRFPAGDSGVSLPMQVIGEADVGDTVRAVPRRIYVEEGVPRYGLKALPFDDNG